MILFDVIEKNPSRRPLFSSMAFAEPAAPISSIKKVPTSLSPSRHPLGYSWLYGRFNDFNGTFTVDADNPEKSSVQATIQTASVDSNHAERDKHLRGDDFLDVDKYPTATFQSTSIEKTGDKTAKITADFTLHGVTKPVTLDAKMIGYGDDPWGIKLPHGPGSQHQPETGRLRYHQGPGSGF